MQPVCKISVDGLVQNSFHLSHRIGNKTPTPFKGDTATESALKFISHPKGASFFPYANIVTNNRFDTDGLLSVFALTNPDSARQLPQTLIAAAESCAFSSFLSDEGVQIDLFLAGLVTHSSPFARSWEKSRGHREALYYKTLLPLLPDLLYKRDEYKDLWRKSFDQILTSMTMFQKGRIGLEEYPDEGLTVILDETPPARHAVETSCKGDLFLVIHDSQRREQGYRYKLLYRYYAWAETIRRPRIPRISMEALADDLNQREAAASPTQEMKWRTKATDMPPTGALLFSNASGQLGLSRLRPDTVVRSVLSHLREAKTPNRRIKSGKPREKTDSHFHKEIALKA